MTNDYAKITMLGTGNAMCVRCYNTCFCLHSPQSLLMVDAGGGNGIFRQLHRARIAFEDIHHLFVTHTHTDHIMGVIWMIRKISPLIHKGKYQAPFTIYCHDEARHALLTMCDLMLNEKIRSAIGNGIVVREVTDGEHIQIDDMQVDFFDIGSTKKKQFGFAATLPDGMRVACLGDEPYNERTERYVRGCDWLLCEAFCLYSQHEQFRPYEKHHSTVLDSARIAAQLEVKNLLLYHSEDTHLATRRQDFTAEAEQAFSGHIVVPDDLDTILL
ncbi:MAG: MBL fold metallo-hydrolase [Muribaculaceae bacterium]|nr:MBL fold metallo-hydrolase [Muribaculaceae bacterium]